jgi:hypothetical protein
MVSGTYWGGFAFLGPSTAQIGVKALDIARLRALPSYVFAAGGRRDAPPRIAWLMSGTICG